MDSMIKVLHCKIHRATVNYADLDYEGSITLPDYLIQAGDLYEYEAVHIWNVTRGTRVETYIIKGEDKDKSICVNGAAAHLIKPNDLIIIASFRYIPMSNLSKFKPKLIFVDNNNQIKDFRKELPGPLVASY